MRGCRRDRELRMSWNGMAAREAYLQIVEKSQGKKFVAMAVMLQGTVPEGIDTKFIWGSALKDNKVRKVVFEDYFAGGVESGELFLCAGAGDCGEGIGEDLRVVRGWEEENFGEEGGGWFVIFGNGGTVAKLRWMTALDIEQWFSSMHTAA